MYCLDKEGSGGCSIWFSKVGSQHTHKNICLWLDRWMSRCSHDIYGRWLPPADHRAPSRWQGQTQCSSAKHCPGVQCLHTRSRPIQLTKGSIFPYEEAWVQEVVREDMVGIDQHCLGQCKHLLPIGKSRTKKEGRPPFAVP
jgi:hypothetical protein